MLKKYTYDLKTTIAMKNHAGQEKDDSWQGVSIIKATNKILNKS